VSIVDELLHIQLLGDTVFRQGDVPVDALSSPRLQLLLVYLLLHRSAPQSRHHVAFQFWPESIEAQALTNLRRLLYRLRHEWAAADQYVAIEAQTVAWRSDAPYALDVAAFEEALEGAARAERRGDLAAFRRGLEEAVAHYGGDLAPSCYEDWIAPERDRLQRAFRDAVGRLAALLEAERDYRGAIELLRRLLRDDPLQEDAYRALMRLYALSGDRAGALRVYHECVTVLERELSVDASAATREVYQRLLQAEAQPVAAGRLEGSRGPALVGRVREWQRLLDVWHEAARGGPRVVLVSGDAGMGKTRLAEELGRWVAQQGLPPAVARCYAAEGELPFGPVVTWLRARPLPALQRVWRTEIARLLPELLEADPELPSPGAMGEPWQRQRLFEALARAILGGRQPLLLVLDDVQWCDASTLEWLHYLLRYDAQARVLVAGTLRLGEADDATPLAVWLQALRRDAQLTEIELGPLGEADTLTLASKILAQDLGPALAACLYAETEGNPLFVVETARSALELGEDELACALQALPPQLQAMIEVRLAKLSAEARELAGVAATIGREFAYPVLAAASELGPDELIQALDELWRRRIVREQGQDGYDFTHDKVREVAYASLSAARQRYVHGRVAEAFEAVTGTGASSASARVARHYQLASLPGRAIPHYLRAAQVARELYANEEAERYLDTALALLPPSPSGAAQRAWRLEALRELGRVSLRMAKLSQAVSRLEEAIALGKGTGLPARELTQLYFWLGEVFYWQHRFADQVRMGQEALALLGDDDASLEAALANQNIAVGSVTMGDWDTFREYTRRTAGLIEGLPYSEELLSAYGHVGQLYVHEKDVERATAWGVLIKRWALEANNPRTLAAAHGFEANLLMQLGHLRASLVARDESGRAARSAGDPNLMAAKLYWEGTTFLALGEPLQVEARAREVLAIERARGITRHVPSGHWLLATSLLAQDRVDEAVLALHEGLAASREQRDAQAASACHHLRGRIDLQQGAYEAAAGHLVEALAAPWDDLRLRWGGSLSYAAGLSGLEEAAVDLPTYQDACRRIQERGSDALRCAPTQWWLEPAEASARDRDPAFEDAFTGGLCDGWVWHDPFGDCAYTVSQGLTIRAANGRDLWHINQSAPRLLRPVPGWTTERGSPAAGSFAVETTCAGLGADLPATGGLLLWADERNYVRLDAGSGGSREIQFLGAIANRDQVMGRGRLPPKAGTGARADEQHPPWLGPVHLRLEVREVTVCALCSLDGVRWFTVGETAFPLRAPQVGLYASGNLDRTIYAGSYREGTAIRFARFSVWRLGAG
jgi:DNA-binding SARP family transcriptional activator